jgi:hypothetical protein
MSSFTWKRPRDLETQQGRETAQDLETRYEGADIEPASLAAWRLLMEQLISSADPAIAFIELLADYAGAAGATSVATACIWGPAGISRLQKKSFFSEKARSRIYCCVVSTRGDSIAFRRVTCTALVEVERLPKHLVKMVAKVLVKPMEEALTSLQRINSIRSAIHVANLVQNGARNHRGSSTKVEEVTRDQDSVCFRISFQFIEVYAAIGTAVVGILLQPTSII